MESESITEISPPPAKKAKVEHEAAETTADKTVSEDVKGTSGETAATSSNTKDSRQCHVSESDVGITQYVSSHQGFTAIIKQRYSDFIVNEVSNEGTVVHLTSTDLPQEVEEQVALSPDPNILSEENQAKLQALLDDTDKNAAILIEAALDKEARTKMHKAIKSLFPSLNSNTVEEDGQKMLRITKMKADQRTRPEWKPSRGNYCRFVLYKENKDTMDAINLISRLARLKTQLFSYAGTKDKRAKTSQEITAFRVTANKLQAVNARLRNMMMGNFSYVKDPLKLGQLRGNHFQIVLRNVTGTDDQITSAMTSLKTRGFINYYGMQRFGTTSIPTHHVGRALLHAQWMEAVDLILKPRESGDDSMRKCREAWGKSRDASAALRYVPSHHSIERTLLETLMRQGETNYANALQALPRNTRLMYAHAYQSYVWNSMTSRRLDEFGYKVKVGDLVIPHSINWERKGEAGESKMQPTVVTDENQSEYSMQDLVLPLPGHDVIYPEGKVGSWYRELMEKDDLDIDNMKQKNKDYSLPGDYRHLLVTPRDVTWDLMTYNDFTVPLSQGDLDVMFNKPQPETLKDGKFRALRLEFSLPSSTYATMALRDILKIDTSSSFQTSLNVTTPTDCEPVKTSVSSS
ncbi:pseudouridylate synthase 7 homolog [Haliotis rufescens]|uniref:pseudouridylate synthase 7 homolog n=1 Tax=Haliotis rufescens TaxID=6454 RepID=UPI00201F90BE|nr:pseudouridylate synthase 7 homolog [Haliotis rufescens]